MFFDAHCDALSCVVTEQTSLDRYAAGRQFDLASAQGIVAQQVLAAFIPRTDRRLIVYDDLLRLQARLMQTIEAAASVKLVTASEELHHWQAGNLGILFALEGAEALEGSLQHLEEIFALGLRILTLTWNNDNAFACGCATSCDMGLRPLGKEAVRLANDRGIAIDIAHLSPQGINDVLRLTQSPILDSHAACAALCPHPRNLSDAQMKALAQNDGVLAITFVDEFLHPDAARATAGDVVRHIVHAAEVMGVEHVGLGSDFDGVERPLAGLTSVRDLPLLIDKLYQAGFHQQEIEDITHGNLNRLFETLLP